MVSQFLIEFILIFGMKSTQRVTYMYSPCMLHTCQYMYLPYSLLTELKTEKNHHFQAFQPLSNYIIIIPNDQKPCKIWFCTSRKENS